MIESTPRTPMTAEELFLIPSDDSKSELIKGLLVRMPPSGALHGTVSAHIARILDEYVRPRGLGMISGAETGFILQRNPDTVRAPDAAFVTQERIPSTGVPESFWPFAPDLAVEVTSLWDRPGEIQEKVSEYLAARTRVVWVIDPRARTVTVYRSPHPMQVLGEEEDLSGDDVLPGFTCPLRRLFE
jgi:Uma2 family endonuclease